MFSSLTFLHADILLSSTEEQLWQMVMLLILQGFRTKSVMT